MSDQNSNALQSFLTANGAQFHQGAVHGFSGVDRPDPLQHIPAISILDTVSLLAIDGTDRATFLQGQLSCDLSALGPLDHKAGCACSPKGRMFSSFHLLNNGERHLMSMNRGLVEPTLTTLKKYAVFYQTELSKCSDLIVVGLSGHGVDKIIESLFKTSVENSQAIRPTENSWLLRQFDVVPRYQWWLPASELETWWSKLTRKLVPTGDDYWRSLDCIAVTPALSPQLIDQFTPQHLNYPSIGRVSFKKGCFTGQEVITRMQTLGTAKSRCFHLSVQGTVKANPADPLLDGNDKSIGNIVDCVNCNDRTHLLGVVRVNAAEADDVWLDSNQPTKLHCLPIPYPTDAKKELQM